MQQPQGTTVAEIKQSELMNPRAATPKHADHWRSTLDAKAIRKIKKEDYFGVRLADMLSRYVSIAEKAFHSLREQQPNVQIELVQLPVIEHIMEKELSTLCGNSMDGHEHFYSLNIACKTPVLADDTDIYAQYQFDIAFYPTTTPHVYINCYSIRRLENDVVNAAAISQAAFSGDNEVRSQHMLNEIHDFSTEVVNSGGILDDTMDGAGYFGILHQTFAASLEPIRAHPTGWV